MFEPTLTSVQLNGNMCIALALNMVFHTENTNTTEMKYYFKAFTKRWSCLCIILVIYKVQNTKHPQILASKLLIVVLFVFPFLNIFAFYVISLTFLNSIMQFILKNESFS